MLFASDITKKLIKPTVNETQFVFEALDEALKSGELKLQEVGIDNGITHLMDAVIEGDQNTFEWLMRQEGLNINEVEINGYTALHLAAEYDHLSMVESLLAKGANPFQKLFFKKHGGTSSPHIAHTPVGIAVNSGNVGILKVLLDHYVVQTHTDKALIKKALHLAEKLLTDLYNSDTMRALDDPTTTISGNSFILCGQLKKGKGIGVFIEEVQEIVNTLNVYIQNNPTQTIDASGPRPSF